jgi:ERCC4-type nuclease
MLTLDTREPFDIVAAVHLVVPSTHIEERALKTGDVAITDRCGCTVGIERKAVNDLLSSISSGRLSKQAARLKQEFDYPVLVIQGQMLIGANGYAITDNRVSGFNYHAVQMLLWSLQTQGIFVLYAAGRDEFAAIVRALHNRCMNSRKCVRGGE